MFPKNYLFVSAKRQLKNKLNEKNHKLTIGQISVTKTKLLILCSPTKPVQSFSATTSKTAS